MIDAAQWIQDLNLALHPEGGHYCQTYKSDENIAENHLPERFGGNRVFSTAIYFLLQSHEFSALHKIKQDELWHFYDGAPLTLHTINSEGHYSTTRLGKDLKRFEVPQIVIKAGVLFGATVDTPDAYTLCGCTVAPGFEFDDFEMPERDTLIEQFPDQRPIIERLTRQHIS